MQSQWAKFLETLQAEPNFQEELANFEIIKAWLEPQDGYRLLIKSPQAVDIRHIAYLRQQTKTHFPYEIKLFFEVSDQTTYHEILIHAYFQDFLLMYLSQAANYSALTKIPVTLENTTIVFHVRSPIQERILADQQAAFATYLKNLGCLLTTQIRLENLEEETKKLLENEEKQRQEDVAIMQKKNAELESISGIKNDPPKWKNREKATIISIHELDETAHNVTFEGRIFQVNVVATRNSKIYNFFLTDEIDSVMIKAFEGKRFTAEFLSQLKEGMYVQTTGSMEVDNFSRELVFNASKIEVIPKQNERVDKSPEKRVELHLHTNMSAMDGVTSIEKYMETAARWGHKAIAVTDHGVLQAFPTAQKAAQTHKIKVLYGVEAYMIDLDLKPAINPSSKSFDDSSYVILDLETTGLSKQYDDIIEFGAVKVVNHMEVDRIQLFIRPTKSLSPLTIKLNGITDSMVANAPTMAQVINRLLAFIGDSIIVAHNAIFDVGFLNESLRRLGKPALTNPVIDTLPLARLICPRLKTYSLGGVARFYNVGYDEESAHRADYDADVLWHIFEIMLVELANKHKISHHQDLNILKNPEVHKIIRPDHVILFAKNTKGLKDLYQLVSVSHTDFIADVPLMPRHLINEKRTDLLVGSACLNGEVFDSALTDTFEQLAQTMAFYDYIEIQPLEQYEFLVPYEKVESVERIQQALNDIAKASQVAKKPLVVTGDVHYLEPRDKVFRDVLINSQAVGSRRHPLFDFKKRIKENPSQHFRTTDEMLALMAFLGPEMAYEAVIKNPQKIADQMEVLTPIPTQLYAPKIEGAADIVETMCFEKAHSMYGKPLPIIVEERLKKELHSIRTHNFSVIYLIAQRLVSNSLKDGYLVGSRGSVGSSLVATFCGITEVNPLPPHYRCRECSYSEFITDGSVGSGYDLGDKICPQCGHLMQGDGHNIPFETFLGIKGDKTPDIDLNFSGLYQARAHNYTKELLGENNVYRAGTISAIKDKIAIGYVKKYFEEIGRLNVRQAEIKRLAAGIDGVKRTTGQHPGGIIVIPRDKDVFDFTPIQFPADETESTWKTTHFEFETLHDTILKLDILGHVDPTALRMLHDITEINPQSLPMNDPKVLSIFSSTNELGLSQEQAKNKVGTSGIPEFGTGFVKGILQDAMPKTFSQLVQVSGLSHGTNVWAGNAQELIRKNTTNLMGVIGCRDDIMLYLHRQGLDQTVAFKIMEDVRKGKKLKPEYMTLMKEKNVPDWYINSCNNIEYLFPKAHAAAYVIMGLRVGWYKIYRPLHYYAVYFSVRCSAYDIETMIKGNDFIRNRYNELIEQNKRKDIPVKGHDVELESVLEIALEMTQRGYHFAPIDLYRSDASNFIVDEERNALIPPFSSIDGLGESVAQSIVRARNEKEFTSREDLLKRTNLNSTHLKVFEKMGVLAILQPEDQLSLF